MREGLYAHTKDVIYERHIESHIKEDAAVPLFDGVIPFNTQGHQYEVTSYLNFIDIDFGKSEVRDGSVCNLQEVAAIGDFVQSLLMRDIVPRDQIAVITPYKAQQKQLKIKAKEQGWFDIAQPGMTIDASQGDEYQVIIESLVTTHGLLGYVLSA